MTPELWQRLKQLYEPACEMSEEDRAQFVAHVDPALRQDLEKLLLAGAGDTNSLDAPLIDFHDLSRTEDQAFCEGDLLLGRFRIVRLLGAGGMGEVYEAIDIQLGRVALKTIVSDITSSPEQLLRFREEVLLARSVSNPHVLRIHELFLSDGPQGAFVTMELLEGTTLADKIRESGPLPWREAKTVALEICDGLKSIHDAVLFTATSKVVTSCSLRAMEYLAPC